MHYSKLALVATLAAGACAAPGGTPVIKPRADSLTLSDDAVQSGSFVDGSTSVGAAEAGQAKSLTSQNNFINNCAGKVLTNGLQITTGSCNGISMYHLLCIAACADAFSYGRHSSQDKDGLFCHYFPDHWWQSHHLRYRLQHYRSDEQYRRWVVYKR